MIKKESEWILSSIVVLSCQKFSARTYLAQDHADSRRISFSIILAAKFA